MLINIIQNTIGVFQNLLGIITNGLKMFLPFSSSQQLGEELVVNGDFSNGTTSWSEEGNSTISVGTHQGKTDVANINITDALSSSRIEQAFDYVNGKQYEVSVEVYLVNGSFRVDSSDSFVSGDFVSTTTTGSWQTLTATITAIQTGTDVIWLRSSSQVSEFYVNSISVKEVGQFSLDETTNNNDAKLLTGNCLDFDGTNDYVDIDGFTMSGSNATFAFWINPDVIANNIYVFDSNAPRTIIGFRGASSPFNLSYFDGGWKEFGAISLNTWQRVVITASGTTAKCYVNGVQLGVDKTITAIDLSSITSAAIGSGNTGGGSFFNGQLSDFQIWNSAWSATDVANDYASPNELVSSVSVSNLKAWWALTEGSGSTAYDSSGEGNNGTINGADYEPAQSSILQLGMINWSNGSGVFLPPSPTNSAQDILGNAVRDRLNSLNLTGTGYGEVADSASINPTSAITIQCWIKSNTENDKGLVAKWKSGATDYMLYKTSGSFRFYIGTDSSNRWNNIKYRLGKHSRYL